MQVTELGFQTELIFHRFNGIVTDRGEYLAIETPSNPTYHWGNLLYFSSPPREGDYKRWNSLFEKEFAHQPQIRHQVFAWEGGRRGAIEEFLQNGFEDPHIAILTADNLIAPKSPNNNVTFRLLESDSDWLGALEVQVACRDSIYEEAPYRTYKVAQMKNYRRMVTAGKGAWYGAFVNGKVVADLGLFVENDLGRYQMVGTLPEFRNQGICKNLLFFAGQRALEAGAAKLVIAVDYTYHAFNIYKSLGFEMTEKPGGLHKSAVEL